MNTFEMKTVIHFGENALERLKDIPYKRVLIITDPFVVQSKMIDLITEPLTRGGKEYDIFHNVVPDAPVDKIAEAISGFKGDDAQKFKQKYQMNLNEFVFSKNKFINTL